MNVCEQNMKSNNEPGFMSTSFWKDPSNYHRDLPSFKRSIELFVNDSFFKKKYLAAPEQTLAEYGLSNIKPLELDILTNSELAQNYLDGGKQELPDLVTQYRQFIQCKMGHSIEIREIQPDHPVWKKWRARMVRATLWREGANKYRRLVHAPYTLN